MSFKRIFLSTLIAVAAFSLCACVNDSAGRGEMGGPRPNRLISQEQLVRNTIVRDVLGGALTTSVDPQAFSFEEAAKRAISVNVGFSTVTSTIDEYYTFKGDDGADSLTIAASGSVEEIDTPETGASLLKYSPLNLLFHFENFVFTNSCGVQATITGDIECRAKGDYNRANENFKGTATCASGTYIEPSNIIYVFGEDEHEVGLSVNVTVDGNPFDLGGYTFTGSFFIDNRLVAIGSFTDENLTCETN